VGYIYTLLIVILFLLVLHYFTEMSNEYKITFGGMMFALIVGAYFYNQSQKEYQEHIYTLVTAYKQGKTLQCKDLNVSQENFSLSIGTYTLIGKKETPHYGVMIDLGECDIIHGSNE